MNNYSIPDGFEFDENSGLYYTQIIAEDENGALSQVVTWFNAETGEYSREIYPIEGQLVSEDDVTEERVGEVESTTSEIDMDALLPPPAEPKMEGFAMPDTEPVKSTTSTGSTGGDKNKKKYAIVGIGVVAVAVIVVIVIIIICMNFFGKNGSQNTGGLNVNMSISNTSANKEQENKSEATGSSKEQSQMQPSSTKESSSKNDSALTDEELEELKEKEAAEANGGRAQEQAGMIPNPVDATPGEEESRKLVAGVYTGSDPEFRYDNIIGPTIVLIDDGTFLMDLNTGYSRETVTGNYSCSVRENEMDDIVVTLFVTSSSFDVPSTAQIIFSDSIDSCQFMTAGFGLMGFDNNGNPPYGFKRV